MLPALETDTALAEALAHPGTQPPGQVHVWIVDTSIECDHQRFAGFLKVSLEEVLIALRDDRHLLDDPDGLVSGRFTLDGDAEEHGRERRGTPIPMGSMPRDSSRLSRPRPYGRRCDGSGVGLDGWRGACSVRCSAVTLTMGYATRVGHRATRLD